MKKCLESSPQSPKYTVLGGCAPMTEKPMAPPSSPAPTTNVCAECDGERVIMTAPPGAGHADDLAEYDPCPTCKGTGESVPSTPSPTDKPEFWGEVHSLLEPWQKIWQGDRARFANEYPAWMLDAAAEIFAHDLCDAWVLDEYLKAVAVIIARHAPNLGVPATPVETHKDTICAECGFDYGSHSRDALTIENRHGWRWAKDACPVGSNPFSATTTFRAGTPVETSEPTKETR